MNGFWEVANTLLSCQNLILILSQNSDFNGFYRRQKEISQLTTMLLQKEILNDLQNLNNIAFTLKEDQQTLNDELANLKFVNSSNGKIFVDHKGSKKQLRDYEIVLNHRDELLDQNKKLTSQLYDLSQKNQDLTQALNKNRLSLRQSDVRRKYLFYEPAQEENLERSTSVPKFYSQLKSQSITTGGSTLRRRNSHSRAFGALADPEDNSKGLSDRKYESLKIRNGL